MNIFFRILLALYAFCLAVISAGAMLITFRTDYFELVTTYLGREVFSEAAREPRIAMFIIALVFFVLSLMFLLSGVKSKKDKKAVSKHTNIGEIRISLNSIENIALTASRRVNGIREPKAFVKRMEDTVSITIKTMVMPDVAIPAVSEEIQDKVKNSVEDNAGITVKSVRVLVEGIYTGNAIAKVRTVE